VTGSKYESNHSVRWRGDTAIREAAMFPPSKAIAALAILASSAARTAAEPAIIDTNVNLRSGPGGAFEVVAVMPEGSRLDVQKCGDEWCRVRFGHLSGYASRGLLKTGADAQISATSQPAAAPAEHNATPTGPYIWDWQNREQRDRAWRRRQWRNRMR
jgi:uncharacterized protein YraI